MLFTTIISLALSALLTQASPVKVARDVVDPQITSPDASTVWTVGKTETVTWDTSNFPVNITNSLGTVLLGFLNDTSGNEHLDVDNPLASGFNITSGSVNIVVPNVADGSDYIIALLGDSGNISPKFTITGGSSSSSASSSPSSAASTTASSSTSDASNVVVTSTTSSSDSASSPTASSPAASSGSGTGPLGTSTVVSTVPGTLSSGSTSSGSATSSGSTSTTTATTSGAMPRFASSALMVQLGAALVAASLFV